MSSQLVSAFGSVECRTTVSYGPTTCCDTTVTEGGALASTGAPSLAAKRTSESPQYGGPAQVLGGGFTPTGVTVSRFWKSASDESPISTLPFTGSTHANEVGLPE